MWAVKPESTISGKCSHDQIIDQDAGLGGGQALGLAHHIAALLDGGQDGRIGGRAADAVFFQGAAPGWLRCSAAAAG